MDEGLTKIKGDKLTQQELELIANLMALMTKADGAIKRSEIFTAEKFLDNYQNELENPKDIDALKTLFRVALEKPIEELDQKDMYKELVDSFDDEQTMRLQNALCVIAACDGAVHPLEHDFIKKFMAEMGTNFGLANVRSAYIKR